MGREADHPPTYRTKNEWIYTSTPPYAFIVWTRYIYFYILHPRERVVSIRNRNWLMFTEIISIGIYRKNEGECTNIRSNEKQMVYMLTTLL